MELSILIFLGFSDMCTCFNLRCVLRWKHNVDIPQDFVSFIKNHGVVLDELCPSYKTSGSPHKRNKLLGGGSKLSNYVLGVDFGKIIVFTFFWVKKTFVLVISKNLGNFDLVGPLLRVPGGVPPGGWGGGGNYRRSLLYYFPALDFEKQKNRTKKSRRMPPHVPPVPLPMDPPMHPPFFSIFFSVLDHRSPLLYSFLLNEGTG